MSFNIDTFLSNMGVGGARSNIFEASISMKGIQGDATNFQYLCKGISIPAQTIGNVIVNYQGRQIKYPGNKTFDDFTTTIINDEGYKIRNKVESWLKQINDHEENVRASAMANRSGYVADMKLQPYNRAGSVATTFNFINCFPVSLDAVDVAWDQNDAIMEFNVTWAFDYWTNPMSTTVGSTAEVG